MPDQPFGPDRLTADDLPKARRGYDKKAVKALLGRAAEAWSAMQEEHQSVVERIAASGGVEYLARDLAALGQEVGGILGAAQEAAEAIRARAEEAAERRNQESKAGAEALLVEAERQAFELRRSAWEVGTRLLEQVTETVTALVADAESDALVVRAEAEKEAHRRIAQARKDGDDIVRQARFEADRLIQSAREIAEQVIAKAKQDAESGTASSEALSEEVHRLRANQSITGVKVLEPDRAEPPPRIDPSAPLSYGELDPGQPGLSEALAAEVSQLHEPLSRAEPDAEPEVPEAPEVVTEAEPRQGGDEVGSLFERLRTTAEQEPVETADRPEDPFELRNGLVLPVHNPAMREAKRRVVDLQNGVLEAVRTGKDQIVEAVALRRELRGALEPMIHKAEAAGADAASRLAGVSGPVVPSDRPRGLLESMVEDLAGQVEKAAAEDGDATRSVARVFRQWRNDDGERWIRTILYAAYHDGLVAALAAGGVDSVRGVGADPSCDACAGAAEAKWSPGAEPPDGLAVPPANVGCLCTVIPG